MLADGFGDNEIRTAIADGSLVRVRRGCYVDGPLDPETRAYAELMARVAGVAARMGREEVFSHTTAAALWGLPFIGGLPSVIHVTVPPPCRMSKKAGLHQHPSVLADDEVVEHQGVRLTSLARALVDVARTEGFTAGVVMADHALRESRARQALPSAMTTCADRLVGTLGVGAARRMCSFADGRSGSPGESLSRLILHDQGVPKPTLQLPLRVPVAGRGAATFVTDFGWEEERVVGEFDGKAKYQRYLGPKETPGDAVMREKIREDAIRAADWRVVRWTWDELKQPDELGRKIRKVLADRAGWRTRGRPVQSATTRARVVSN